MKGSRIALVAVGAVAVVAAVGAAAGLAQSGSSSPTDKRSITTTGTGSAKTVPNVAQWSFGIEVRAASADAALREAGATMRRIVAALKGAGVAAADLQTDHVSVYPQTSDDGRTITGYSASSSVTAIVRNLARAGAVVEAAMSAGATNVSGPALSVADTKELEADALADAFDDARAKARALAAKAGASLGEPIAIIEDAGGGPIIPLNARAALGAETDSVAIEPGQSKLNARVTVTFAIA